MTDLEKALRLADEADAITIRYYRTVDLRIDTKPDNTPVTEGDMAVDKRLRTIITEEYSDACLSEESEQGHVAGRQWVIDPIDGTKNFMRGFPIWGTLIALSDNGEVIASVVSCPALGRRWWAAKGQGAWTRDTDGSTRQIHTSGVADLKDAFILHSTPLSAWNRIPAGEKAVQKLLDSVWRYRAPDDMVNYMWLAEGAADICFEPYAKQWDIEAPKLIVTEAGGSFWTDARADTPADAERVVIATNGPLEPAVLESLGL